VVPAIRRVRLPPPFVAVSGGVDGLLAHHGFGSFDIKVMYYIAGRVTRLEWADPHFMLNLEVEPGLKVPPDIWSIEMPRDAEIAMSIPDDLVPLPIGAQPETWELTMPSLERARKIGLDREAVEPGRMIAGIGYRGCDMHDNEFRCDLLLIDGKAYALRPFALPPETCV
jgi:hypothetical protein